MAIKKIAVHLDKERNLAFPLMSLVRLKKEYGLSLQDLADEQKAQDIENIIKVIWAGLIHEDKELTVEDVGYMIDISELPAVSEKISMMFKDMTSKN